MGENWVDVSLRLMLEEMIKVLEQTEGGEGELKAYYSVCVIENILRITLNANSRTKKMGWMYVGIIIIILS